MTSELHVISGGHMISEWHVMSIPGAAISKDGVVCSGHPFKMVCL